MRVSQSVEKLNNGSSFLINKNGRAASGVTESGSSYGNYNLLNKKIQGNISENPTSAIGNYESPIKRPLPIRPKECKLTYIINIL